MIEDIAAQARRASIRCASLLAERKNGALKAVAQALASQAEDITRANDADLARAQKDRLNPVLIKRLKFDREKLQESIAGVESLTELADPVGTTLAATELDDGLKLYKVTCPIGVLGVVFESRPDALVQIAALALKSGNAVLLKGGAEAAETNRTLSRIMLDAAIQAGAPAGWMALLQTRDDVKAMLALDNYIDLIIPRGSNSFVRYIMNNTRIPVLGHADGICHVYIDAQADLEKAGRIAFDAKCQYPAVCNAVETLLVHARIAPNFLPAIQAEYDRAGVELRGDEQTRQIISVVAAEEQDWRTEYNDLILSVKIVDGVRSAIEHINNFSSRHTDAIVTEDADTAGLFMSLVDSANVFWNCSTRFADGFRYGLGAEVGISTNKVHARGPVGLEGLVTYKWKLIGAGNIVADYCGPAAKSFTHKALDEECPL